MTLRDLKNRRQNSDGEYKRLSTPISYRVEISKALHSGWIESKLLPLGDCKENCVKPEMGARYPLKFMVVLMWVYCLSLYYLDGPKNFKPRMQFEVEPATIRNKHTSVLEEAAFNWLQVTPIDKILRKMTSHTHTKMTKQWKTMRKSQ